MGRSEILRRQPLPRHRVANWAAEHGEAARRRQTTLLTPSGLCDPTKGHVPALSGVEYVYPSGRG